MDPNLEGESLICFHDHDIQDDSLCVVQSLVIEGHCKLKASFWIAESKAIAWRAYRVALSFEAIGGTVLNCVWTPGIWGDSLEGEVNIQGLVL